MKYLSAKFRNVENLFVFITVVNFAQHGFLQLASFAQLLAHISVGVPQKEE